MAEILGLNQILTVNPERLKNTVGRGHVFRHGETFWNVKKRLQGRSDTEENDLTPEAIAQMLEAGAHLRTENPQASFMIFTSPLRRTLRSSRSLAEGMGYSPEETDNLLVPIDELVEFSFGKWEGIPQSQLKANSLHEDIWLQNPIVASRDYALPPLGESLIPFLIRINRAFNHIGDLIEKQEDHNAIPIVMTHAMVSRGMNFLYRVATKYKGTPLTEAILTAEANSFFFTEHEGARKFKKQEHGIQRHIFSAS